ncbi:MAG: MATE family efflux transporter [Saprospiraceae bacterium]
MNKEILRLAIPNIISNISIPLISSVDTALMGRMSPLHIGAVGIGAMVFNFIYWNFGFLRMGTTGITAQAFGAKQESTVILTLLRALIIGVVVALTVMILQTSIGRISFSLLNVSENQLDLVQRYFDVRIWAAPATLCLYGLMGWFFGMQNAIYPLVLTIVINVLNLGLSFFFVFYWGMDVEGVAWGTVIAQYTGLSLGIFLFFFKYRYLLDRILLSAVVEWKALKHFFQINWDIFLRTVCLTFAFGFFYSQSSVLGDQILAINVILLQFLNWMSYGVDGFAYASESLVGKYKGAKQLPEVRRAIRYVFAWGTFLAILFSLLYGGLQGPLLDLFTDDEPLKLATAPYFFWMILLPIIGTPCYIWDGVFVGLVASRAMRDSMLIALLIYLLSYYFWLTNYGNHGLWLALMIFLFVRGVIQFALYRWGDVGLTEREA